jgi:TatD DNase family protein
MFIDSHAHLTSPQIIDQVEELIKRAKREGVDQIINICTDRLSLEKGIALAEKHPFIFNVAATTPHDVEKEGASFFPIVAESAAKKQLIAIGETGLDYHYLHSPKELQKKYLIDYLHLALESHLPIVIHCRDAFNDLFSIADSEYKRDNLLLHCFTGTLEEAKKALDRGWSISFSGIITFKKSEGLREVLKYVPLDRILVETDTPYLAPQSKRGQINEPAFLPETVAMVAEIKKVDLIAAARATSKNASLFFSLEKQDRFV